MALLFLTLYSIATVSLLGDFIDRVGSDDDDDAPDDDVATPTEAAPPEDLLELTEPGTYTTGPADDTVINDVPIPGGVALSTADGDDTIDLTVDDSAIDAGLGDDTITVEGANNAIKGRAGLDTIVVQDQGNSDIDSGFDDDVVTVTRTDSGAEASSVDLGKGDDSVTWQQDVEEQDGTPPEASVLLGGDGADTFRIELDVGLYAGDGSAVGPGEIIKIQDFEKGEDVLVIDVSGTKDPDDDLDRPFESVEIVENDAGTDTSLVIRYSATDDAPALEAEIGLKGVTGLTLDDISILEPA
ncbi:hypothetical protein [Algirhabdus cladophorae]|uniref:hypothetical protein n=1 Tax=Algirhabdus cladophorae TaxID=3377108 RepID=UPI003B84700B